MGISNITRSSVTISKYIRDARAQQQQYYVWENLRFNQDYQENCNGMYSPFWHSTVSSSYFIAPSISTWIDWKFVMASIRQKIKNWWLFTDGAESVTFSKAKKEKIEKSLQTFFLKKNLQWDRGGVFDTLWSVWLPSLSF
jgi:hypothetical protein